MIYEMPHICDRPRFVRLCNSLVKVLLIVFLLHLEYPLLELLLFGIGFRGVTCVLQRSLRKGDKSNWSLETYIVFPFLQNSDQDDHVRDVAVVGDVHLVKVE